MLLHVSSLIMAPKGGRIVISVSVHPSFRPDGSAVWGVVVSTRWWLLVDHCVLSNWDRILVRAVKGLISRAGMVSICPLLWQRDVKLQQTNQTIRPSFRPFVTDYFCWRVVVCVRFSSETIRPISPMMIPINWGNNVDVQRALHFDLDPLHDCRSRSQNTLILWIIFADG